MPERRQIDPSVTMLCVFFVVVVVVGAGLGLWYLVKGIWGF